MELCSKRRRRQPYNSPSPISLTCVSAQGMKRGLHEECFDCLLETNRNTKISPPYSGPPPPTYLLQVEPQRNPSRKMRASAVVWRLRKCHREWHMAYVVLAAREWL